MALLRSLNDRRNRRFLLQESKKKVRRERVVVDLAEFLRREVHQGSRRLPRYKQEHRNCKHSPCARRVNVYGGIAVHELIREDFRSVAAAALIIACFASGVCEVGAIVAAIVATIGEAGEAIAAIIIPAIRLADVLARA